MRENFAKYMEREKRAYLLCNGRTTRNFWKGALVTPFADGWPKPWEEIRPNN